jgi:hypothetical protein
LSDAKRLEVEAEELEDEALQKRFAALFDDGQGGNARQSFVAYCRAKGYHPSDITLLYGSNIFRRLRDMIDRQNALLDEYRTGNKFLFDEAKRLNKGKAVIVPKPENVKRGAAFGILVRQKFGAIRGAKAGACNALGVSPKQFDRMMKGFDLTDGLIDRLEDLPDAPPTHNAKRLQRTARAAVSNPRLAEFEGRFGHLRKPKKYGRRSEMTREEFIAIAKRWFGEHDWIEPMSRFLNYGTMHIRLLAKGDQSRFITVEMEEFIRRVEGELRVHGNFIGRLLPTALGS